MFIAQISNKLTRAEATLLIARLLFTSVYSATRYFDNEPYQNEQKSDIVTAIEC
jgi:hypothetical protein